MANFFSLFLRNLDFSIQSLYCLWESLLNLIFKDDRFHVNGVLHLLNALQRGFDFFGYLFHEFELLVVFVFVL